MAREMLPPAAVPRNCTSGYLRFLLLCSSIQTRILWGQKHLGAGGVLRIIGSNPATWVLVREVEPQASIQLLWKQN